jgi:hypothetical protein
MLCKKKIVFAVMYQLVSSDFGSQSLLLTRDR